MADPQLLQIPKHPDKKLLDCFINICNNFNVDKLSINVIGAPQIGSIDREHYPFLTASGQQISHRHKKELDILPRFP